MTSREYFVITVKGEIPRFERLIKALPKSKLKYRPHSKSRSALELLDLFANESSHLKIFMQTGLLDFAKAKHKEIKSIGQALKTLLAGLEQAVKIAAKLNEAQWNSSAKMVSGTQVEWETTRGNMAWGVLLDLIHHRGQLSTYIRPMGGKVPPIYGPSGDNK